MKKLLFIFLAIALFHNAPAYAGKDGLPIAVVDVQKVVQESSAAKDINAQIKASRDKYLGDVTKEEERLRTAEKKLSDQRSLLSAEAFEQKKAQFQEDILKAQRDIQAKRTKLDEAFNKALDQIQVVIYEIIDDLANDKDYQLVLPRSQTLFANKNLDITDEVLARLNKKLPSLKVKME